MTEAQRLGIVEAALRALIREHYGVEGATLHYGGAGFGLVVTTGDSDVLVAVPRPSVATADVGAMVRHPEALVARSLTTAPRLA